LSHDDPTGKPATTRESNPSPNTYPWAREREALAALRRFDLEECRRSLVALGTELESLPGAEPGPTALLLGELLARLRATLRPEGDVGGGPAADEARADRAQRLGNAPTLAALRACYVLEVESLFRPLANGWGHSSGVVRARAHLDLNFRRRVGLREVAKAVSLSPNYLSSLFRKETGTTVTGYVRLRRMRLAEQLLVEGNRTISEVAYLVGYQNYRDFHRNFVRHAGRSPRDFQHQCRAERRTLGGGARDPKPGGGDET
jgi:AraC-like DNA-binding protein